MCGWCLGALSNNLVCVGYVVVQSPSCIQLFCDPIKLYPARLLCPWDFPGKNTDMCCCFLLQGIFPTRDQTYVFCTGRQILYHTATWEAHLCIQIDPNWGNLQKVRILFERLPKDKNSQEKKFLSIQKKLKCLLVLLQRSKSMCS